MLTISYDATGKHVAASALVDRLFVRAPEDRFKKLSL